MLALFFKKKIMNFPTNKKPRILVTAVLYPHLPLSKGTKYYLESCVISLPFFSNRVLLTATYFLLKITIGMWFDFNFVFFLYTIFTNIKNVQEHRAVLKF